MRFFVVVALLNGEAVDAAVIVDSAGLKYPLQTRQIRRIELFLIEKRADDDMVIRLMAGKDVAHGHQLVQLGRADNSTRCPGFSTANQARIPRVKSE